MAVVLLIIGGMGFTSSTTAKWVSGALLIFLNLAYNSTLGPVCYTLVAEISSTRLRAKTISLSRVAYQLMNIICGIIVPRQLSPAEWNWGPKSGLFWAGSAILTFCYVWLRVPETRNRSYGELDLLFENRIPAWRFAKTKVDREYQRNLPWPSANITRDFRIQLGRTTRWTC
jgi:SP family general alpha glucoside:H+ symporter-like MFS transporter